MSESNAKLDPRFIEQQRKRLVALRAQLLGGEEQGLKQARAIGGDYREEAQELEDEAQRMEERQIQYGLYGVEEGRLRAIDRALQKIDEGTYGLSDLSGEAIPKARLKILPEAFLTVQEEESRELRAK